MAISSSNLSHRPRNVLFVLLLLSLHLFTTQPAPLTFSDVDKAPTDGKISEAEWNAYAKPSLSLPMAGLLSSFGIGLEEDTSEPDASFLGGFFNSWAMIIATEVRRSSRGGICLRCVC